MIHVVLLHGALGSSEDFHRLERQLTTQGIHVTCFNFQGHGKKPLTNIFGIDEFSEDILNFMVKENLKQPYVFGYSMGGYVALNAAVKNKNSFSGIITLGTKFNWTKEFTEKEVQKLNLDLIMEKAPGFVEHLKLKHGNFYKDLLIQTAGMMQTLTTSCFDFLNSLETITVPVWIGRADKDKMVNMEECVLAQQKIECSGYFVLPETGHVFESADPLLLAELIMRFIKKYGPTEAQANG